MKSKLPLLLQRLKEAYQALSESSLTEDMKFKALENHLYQENRVKSLLTELREYHASFVTQAIAEDNQGNKFILYYYGMNQDEIDLMFNLVDGPTLNLKNLILGPSIPMRKPIPKT